MQEDDTDIRATERAEVLETLQAALRDTYVHPETASALASAVRARTGHYETIADPKCFAEALTGDLRATADDKHLRAFYSPEGKPPAMLSRELTPEMREHLQQVATATNGGFTSVARLDGNIGCLRLDGFMPPDIAGEKAAAAMTLLADTDALILDLRANHGGSPLMVAFLTSYLFGPEPVHLNDLYWRPTDTTQQFWTLPFVPGRRFGADKPVFVLISAQTFSGGEEFAYNLKALQRANLVGETTAGGAHPGEMRRLSEHFFAFIPTGRAINPVTGTNWEGTGVTPDVPVPAEDALRTAHILALQALLDREAIPPLAEERRETLCRLEAEQAS